MNPKEWEERTYHEMRNLLDKDQAALLTDLKQRAIDVEIDKRKEFENSLLRLVRNIVEDNKRNAIYEVLVSLQSTWTRNRPEKGLQAKFRTAFDAGNYREAEDIYKRLARQGLDLIDTFQPGDGWLIPIFADERGMLLHYNKKKITFYNMRFEQLAKLSVPSDLEIIDAVVLFLDETRGESGSVEIKEPARGIWLLLENENKKKFIVSLDIANIEALETIERRLEHDAIELDRNLGRVHRLAYFQNRLLLISNKKIYYYEERNWQEWYTTGNKITAIESTNEGFWAGHANGFVVMLKDLQHVGIREVLHGFLDPIEAIRSTGRYVYLWSEKSLIIADHGCKPVSEPIATHCRIIQAAILEENLLLLTANGMLTARDIDRGNIRWQINLGDRYDILFPYRRLLFCWKKDRQVMLFEIPAFHIMMKEMENKNIHVEKQSLDLDPNAPVRYIFEFKGRTNILDEIKNAVNSHFILFGEPRIGKTSLLNVLQDALSETARCCIIDMAHLLKDADSYEVFEKRFMKQCMEHHFLNLPLPTKQGCNYQELRLLINKIRGDKNFCVFCLDNFFIPTHFDPRSQVDFKTFLSSMLQHPNVRFIITCSKKYRVDIETYFGYFKDALKLRYLLHRVIPLFSEGEVKNMLRGKISLKQSVIDEVYKYIGRFPHLIHFYDSWVPGSESIEEQSNKIIRTFSDKIFDYFRDLSLNARLLIATLLYENLVNEKISYNIFYDRFPFLKKNIPDDQLDKTLEEIKIYGSGISVEKEKDSFKVSLSDNAHLFYKAVRNIPWIMNFKNLLDFTSAPDQGRAKNAGRMFTRITRSELEASEHLEQINKKFNEKFYIAKLTAQGLQALKMPLTTFFVIPIKPWRKKDYGEAFQDLYIEFQEFTRQTGEAPIFYTLLFNLHGAPVEEIKKDLEGFDRISIIDAEMMKDIILAGSPQGMASGFIFDQLSIRERSPYTISGAVPDSLFFGREMELALIRGLPENIGVFGTRTIGKTSLLRKLHKAFQLHKKWKVYDMDCARIESEETLLKNLAEKMEITFDEISDMDKFRQYVTREAEKGGHRYLFLLDEVDRLVEYDMRHDERIFNTLNRLCTETMKNNETAARFILFGFQQMFEQMKNPKSRLYNFMVFLPLQTLDMEGAMGLVTRPIEDIRVRWNSIKDAEYLVDNCSRHPRLLQAACQALLSNLDDKKIDRNTIERDDVNKALMSQGFREICMRLYHAPGESRDDSKKSKKDDREKTLFTRIRGKDTNEKSYEIRPGEEFLGDIHRIIILAAVRLLFKEKKEVFTIRDIQAELKRDDIDVSPDIMRNILDRLCLSGNFRLQEESIIIAKDGARLRQEVCGINIDDLDRNITDLKVYEEKKSAIPKFTYEFGVKIFPRLLAAHFDGIDQCEVERQKLIKKGAWREWLRRYYE